MSKVERVVVEGMRPSRIRGHDGLMAETVAVARRMVRSKDMVDSEYNE